MASCRSATLACKRNPRGQSNLKPLRRILNPDPDTTDRSQPPPGLNQEPAGGGGGRRGGEAADTYRVVEVDSALDDLPAAPGHDRDLHPAPLARRCSAVTRATADDELWRRRGRDGEGVAYLMPRRGVRAGGERWTRPELWCSAS
jgi:hypothetical protein